MSIKTGLLVGFSVAATAAMTLLCWEGWTIGAEEAFFTSSSLLFFSTPLAALVLFSAWGDGSWDHACHGFGLMILLAAVVVLWANTASGPVPASAYRRNPAPVVFALVCWFDAIMMAVLMVAGRLVRVAQPSPPVMAPKGKISR